MSYKVRIAEKLEKTLARIGKKDRERIFDRISLLESDPRPKESKKLKGQNKATIYRIRSGNYRILYTIEDEILLVLVVDIDHRKNIYRDY